MKIRRPKYNWQSYNFGSISLCMIMKNEEKVLRRFFNNVAGLADEIIIVDTGSSDSSPDIARAFGATVLFDKWQDDFSRPRNIALRHATKDWILIMDPDEVLMHKDHEAVRWLTRSSDVVAWRLTTRNYARSPQDPGYVPLKGDTDPTGKFTGYVPSRKTRLFKNGLGIQFKGCWHELVDWYIIHYKLKAEDSSIPIHHWNHEFSQATIKEKGLFYLRLGEKKVREWPENGQAWWELGVAQAIQGQRGAAASSFAAAFRRGFGWHSQFFTLARILRFLGKETKASYAFEKGVCGLFPNLTHIETEKKKLEPLIQGL